mmetsp:Transcript_12253/g.28663  ORF Transcript_12253/g.28663 Transcript_12253/m.28663 type:complete len:250 (-) Transcript_12253:216-965(-)
MRRCLRSDRIHLLLNCAGDPLFLPSGRVTTLSKNMPCCSRRSQILAFSDPGRSLRSTVVWSSDSMRCLAISTTSLSNHTAGAFFGTIGTRIPAFGGSEAPPLIKRMGVRNRVPSKSNTESHWRRLPSLVRSSGGCPSTHRPIGWPPPLGPGRANALEDGVRSFRSPLPSARLQPLPPPTLPIASPLTDQGPPALTRESENDWSGGHERIRISTPRIGTTHASAPIVAPSSPTSTIDPHQLPHPTPGRDR